MKKRGMMILTSTGLSVGRIEDVACRLFDQLPHKSVAIITTAANGKENNKYSKKAASQFEKLGFNTIDFVDIETQQQVNFSKYSVIYVCGGNTFKLLKYARDTELRKSIQELIERGGIYIGVSAGSIILSPTIQIVTSVESEPNETNMVDLRGLELVDFEIHPHYEPAHDAELSFYIKNTEYEVIAISDSQAIVISGSERLIVE